VSLIGVNDGSDRSNQHQGSERRAKAFEYFPIAEIRSSRALDGGVVPRIPNAFSVAVRA